MPIGAWEETEDYADVTSIYPGILDSFEVLVSTINLFVQDLISLEEFSTVFKQNEFVRFILKYKDSAIEILLKDKKFELFLLDSALYYLMKIRDLQDEE